MIKSGEYINLYVTAIGKGALNYQWKKDGIAITEGSLPHCYGVNEETLIISKIFPEHEGKYTCVVGNADGESVETKTANLKLTKEET